VFTDARIVERSQGYIAVKIDGGNYPALMEKLGVGGYPYLGFFNPKGQVTREIRGYMPLESFLGEMPYAPPSDDITAPGETVKRSTM
jgi:thioredoxin-related protein